MLTLITHLLNVVGEEISHQGTRATLSLRSIRGSYNNPLWSKKRKRMCPIRILLLGSRLESEVGRFKQFRKRKVIKEPKLRMKLLESKGSTKALKIWPSISIKLWLIPSRLSRNLRTSMIEYVLRFSSMPSQISSLAVKKKETISLIT